MDMRKRWVRILALGMASLLLGGGLFLPVPKSGLKALTAQAAERKGRHVGGGYAVTGQIEGVGYSTELYDAENGLPTSDANAICCARNGFIWIGSYSGLISYDGTTFHRFEASTGVASVVCLFVDSKDRLWIGTNDSGLVLYEQGDFTFFNKNEGLRSSSVRAIAEDANGDILVATTQGMAYVSDDRQVHLIDDPQINNEYINQIKPDGFGNICGVPMTGGIFRIKDKRVTDYVAAKNNAVDAVNCICPDATNRNYIYIGTDNDYIWYGDITKGFAGAKKYMTGTCKNINNIKMIGKRTWVCSDTGLGWLDGEKICRGMNGIPLDNSIDDIITDHEGNYWVTSSRQGVMKIVNNQFTDVTGQAGMETMVVNSTCLYEDAIYMGTDTGLRIVDKEFKEREDELTKKLEGVRIRCLMKDEQENLWISTFDGETGVICQHKDGSIKAFTEKEGLRSNWIRSTCLLSDGTVAVAASGGVSLIRDERVVKTYGADEGVNNSEILTVCEGEDGELYFGSDGDGIYVVKNYREENTSVSRISVAEGLSSEVILRILYDKERGGYWVLTSNSIEKMKDGKAQKIEQFPYSNNFDIRYDNHGDIWVLSSNGLYEVNADQMMQNGEIDYQHYDADAGLTCMPTANSWSALDEDGTLYIAGTTGVSSVNINEIEDEAADVKLTVPYVMVDDTPYYITDSRSIVLPSTASRLVIHGYALTYALKNPRITYKLSGFDEEETVTTKSELIPVTYTNLPGDNYKFQMNVVNTVTGKVENSYQLMIEKEKKFSENPWFILLETMAGIAFVGMIIWLITFRRFRREKKKRLANQEFIDQTISAFAKLIDAKDKYTQGHSRRVAAYTEKLAKKLGFDEDEVRKYKNIALLHDIGKVAIPDNILNKPQGLTDEEYEIMKSHAKRGQDILDEIRMEPDLALGAGYHHERFDGRGYPEGLHGDKIPPVAQLIAVADTFDAMYSTRPYRKQLPLSVVLEELRSIAGTQLNETYVKAFLQLAEDGELVDLKEAKRREEAAEPEG